MSRSKIPLVPWKIVEGPAHLVVDEGMRFWYPTSCQPGVPLEYVEIVIQIERVESFPDNQWLITGFDLEDGKRREFWWHRMYRRPEKRKRKKRA